MLFSRFEAALCRYKQTAGVFHSNMVCNDHQWALNAWFSISMCQILLATLAYSYSISEIGVCVSLCSKKIKKCRNSWPQASTYIVPENDIYCIHSVPKNISKVESGPYTKFLVRKMCIVIEQRIYTPAANNHLRSRVLALYCSSAISNVYSHLKVDFQSSEVEDCT